MPYGLRNSSATFQRMMHMLFVDLKCVFIYLDDILIFSDDEETHLKDLTDVLQILSENDLKVSINKCLFNVEQLDFLGHNVSFKGLKPTERKINEINDFPAPNDSKSLRRFLGMIGFYRKLVPNFTNLTLPLTECIRLNPNSKELKLSLDELKSFENIKLTLKELSTLAYPDSVETNFQLVTDSSNFAIGGVLHQMINGEPIPIGFYSKKLSQAQQKYSTFDRELLAAYLCVLHFKYQIEGRNIILVTDHKPIVCAFKSVKPLKSDRQQRHLLLLNLLVM